MTYQPDDPSTWSRSAASGFCLGLDIGLSSDHSAIVIGGVWQQAGGVIGIVHTEQMQIGTPLTEVAERAADVSRKFNAKIVADLSNNSAFASILAPLLGRQPANTLTAAVITGAHSHATTPMPLAITVGNTKAALPKYTLSKRELIETLDAEFASNTLRIGRGGDSDKLHAELADMQRIAKESGNVSYSAPPGKHDDLVVALALAVYGLRRIGGQVKRSSRPQGAKFSAAAWT